jgi:uncharacterized protein YlxW (UPF0749 family)
MKILSALFFALVTTVIIAVTMLVIGGNALLNKNSVPILNSPAAAAIPKSADAASTNLQQQVDQMQQLINQYQDREKQYQAELQQAAQPGRAGLPTSIDGTAATRPDPHHIGWTNLYHQGRQLASPQEK